MFPRGGPYRPPRFVAGKLPAALPQIVAGALGLFALVVAAWAVFGNDPLGGEPLAVVATKMLDASPGKHGGASDGAQHARCGGPADEMASDAAVAVKIDTPPAGTKTITIIDGSSGKTQEVMISGNAADNPAKTLADVHPNPSEQTRHGAVPAIGPKGERVLAQFAHPRVLPVELRTAPRIAIIVTGLGISASAPPALSPNCRRQ